MLDDDMFGDEDDILEETELGIDYAIGDPGVEQHLQKPPKIVLSAAMGAMTANRPQQAPRKGTLKTLTKVIANIKRDSNLNRLLVTFADGDSLLIKPN